MRDVVIKKIKFATADVWNGPHPAIVLVKIDHANHSFAFHQISGGDPNQAALEQFLLNDRDALAEMLWAANEFHAVERRETYVREGMSGCLDVTVRTTDAPEWAAEYDLKAWKKRLNWYVSCFGKVSLRTQGGAYSVDLYDACRAISKQVAEWGSEDWFVYEKPIQISRSK